MAVSAEPGDRHPGRAVGTAVHGGEAGRCRPSIWLGSRAARQRRGCRLRLPPCRRRHPPLHRIPERAFECQPFPSSARHECSRLARLSRQNREICTEEVPLRSWSWYTPTRRYAGDRRSPTPPGRIPLDIAVIIAHFPGQICGDDHRCFTRSVCPGQAGTWRRWARAGACPGARDWLHSADQARAWPASRPGGRWTYHSVNSRHRPAESKRITKQLSNISSTAPPGPDR